MRPIARFRFRPSASFRRVGTVGAATAALILSASLLSASHADSEEGDGGAAELPELGTAESVPPPEDDSGAPDLSGATVAVNTLEAAGQGGFASMAWTVTAGEELVQIADFSTSGRKTGFVYGETGLSSTSHVVLHDPAADVRHFPNQDSETECLCSGPRSPQDYPKKVEPGESATFWNSYTLPDDVESVNVEVPGFAPVEDVPVG